MGNRVRLRLLEVLEVMRLVREACELGSDPARWRAHVLERLSELLDADEALAAFIDREASGATEMPIKSRGRSWRIASQVRVPGTSNCMLLAFARDEQARPFEHRQRRLLALFHQELARLWVTPVLGALPQWDRDVLSPRLRQVLDMLVRGADEKAIARSLGRSPHPVHNHVRILYRRLGVKSRAELLAGARGTSEFRPKL